MQNCNTLYSNNNNWVLIPVAQSCSRSVLAQEPDSTLLNDLLNGIVPSILWPTIHLVQGASKGSIGDKTQPQSYEAMTLPTVTLYCSWSLFYF